MNSEAYDEGFKAGEEGKDPKWSNPYLIYTKAWFSFFQGCVDGNEVRINMDK